MLKLPSAVPKNTGFPRKEQLFVELVRRAFNQFQFVTQLLCQIFTNRSIEIRVIQPFNNADFLNGVPFTALIEIVSSL